MTNLFGKSKEPFWQQASTNLVKFVILLHKTLDDYVTLFQVYEHVINPDKLRSKIAEGERRFAAKNRRLVIDKTTYIAATRLHGWTWQAEVPGDHMWAHWSADLAEALGTTHITSALSLTQLLTFTVFVIFYIPCAATVAAMSREIGWKGAAVAVVSTLALATGLALLTRGFGTLVF